MKKIGIEIQPLLQRKTGIGWYNHNLINAMKTESVEINGLMFNFLNRNKIELELSDQVLKDIKSNYIIPYSVYRRIWRHIPIPYDKMFDEKMDVYHFLNYIVPPVANGKVVLNIYDMVYKRFPETMHDRTRKNLEMNLSNLSSRVDRIVTISEFSKNEILNYIDFDSNKIDIIYPGVDHHELRRKIDDESLNSIKHKYGISKSYFIYIGTIEPRKNVETILNAFNELIVSRGKEFQLVLVGMKGWKYESVMKMIHEKFNESDIIMTGYVDERTKISLLKGALGFVFPSYYEGFGLPVIEALAASTPTIVSNIPVFHEIAGESVLYTKTDDFNELKHQMEKLIDSSDLRKELAEKGIVQVEEYTWENAAQKMIETYMKL